MPQAQQADIDSPLPIDDYWQPSPPQAPRAAHVRIEKIGDDIVNSVSIHKIQDEEAHLYDVVAVLTNNDKSVRVFSLHNGIETTCLTFSFPMNHASISPDGSTLVAVGDSNQVFFYEMLLEGRTPQIPKPHNRLNMLDVAWQLTKHVSLRPEPVSRDPAQAPGYFTTAWSPSGRLVAVGSEGGQISVFDTLLFQFGTAGQGEDAIVATVPSTRPNIAAHLHPGAVRTIIFSPEPWDLLIWAEDQGRVCIGDLRTGLRTKQVIDLKPDEEGLDKVDVDDDITPDRASPEDHGNLSDLQDTLLRHGRDSEANLDSETSQARERLGQQQNLRRDFPSLAETTTLEDDPQGLTAREQQILDSLRIARQRTEARERLGSLPRSVNYTSPAFFSPSILPSSHTPTTAQDTASRPFSDVLVNHSDPYAAFPELSRARNLPASRETGRTGGDNTLPPLNSIQEYLRLRDRVNQDSAALNSGIGNSATASRRRDDPPPHATRAPNTSSPSASGDDSDAAYAETEENPWTTITEAMNLAHGPLFTGRRPDTNEPASSSAAPATGANSTLTSSSRDYLRRIANQRERLRSIRREFDATEPTRATGTTTSTRVPNTRSQLSYDDYAQVLLARRASTRDVSIGVRTAGLATSRDGRVLFVACEEGIFEIRINVKGRMFFPAVDMR